MALGKNRVWPASQFAFVGRQQMPNKFIYKDIETVEIAGINITFMYLPGECDDMMALWLADRHILLPGDDVYKSFPNLYAIRGSATRDVLVWANSVQKLRDMNSDLLLPQHGYPVKGRQAIYDILTAYESGILYVHDQTVRHMNKLVHPEEIARLVKLPDSLVNHPYLRQQYGRVDWSSRSIYERYIGWFSGDPVDLEPLTPSQRAQRLIKTIGADRMLDEASEAVKSADFQWALELCSHVLRIEANNARARHLRLESLRSLAAQEINPSARNYYLTAALDDHHLIDWRLDRSEFIAKTHIGIILDLMKTRLKAELTEGQNVTLYLHFNDTHSTYKLQIVYSVLNVDLLPMVTSPSTTDPSLLVIICNAELTWKLLLTGKLPAATAFTDGSLTVRGDLETFKQFLSYFD
jgi:alkyl sulfatase BDS1-like metallo-beta-lactamase superfamily hydrolase